MIDPPLQAWADAVRAALTPEARAMVGRVVVVEETTSTQDTARAMAAERPGLVVIAERQTAGRGRLGRSWVQGDGRGLAMTLAVDPACFAPAHLSLGAGVAVARALSPLAPGARIGLRWPNDAVERVGGRKLAGVLIEGASRLLLVGIGVNVHQAADDWPDDLRGRAVSLRQLGSGATRVDAAAAVLVEMARALALSAPALADEWRTLDTLVGAHATFVCEGAVLAGRVESIDPAHAVTLRLPDGTRRVLPAPTTSLVQASTSAAVR